MDMRHVHPFLEAMDNKRSDVLTKHLSTDVVLYSPFVVEPFVGREAVHALLAVLLSAVDEFTTTAIIADENRAAIILRIRVGDVQVTGVDDMSIDGDGLICRMSVQWRPLANIVAIQQKLAPLIGVPSLILVEKQLG